MEREPQRGYGMSRFNRGFFPVLLLFFLTVLSCTHSGPAVTLHYLGHSCVFLDFEGKVSVLCDYGMKNAYLEWGWDSPIYDAGEPGPDIITYSHAHNDHFDPERAEKYNAVILSDMTDTTIKRLSIKTFESSENDISKYDNLSFLFTYKNLRVLHLGDCQADIMMINDPAVAWNIEERYPKGCDILIMPIEGTQQYILQAVKMVELLEPKVLIPTHFWSHAYKLEFLNEIEGQYKKKGKSIFIPGKYDTKFHYQKKDIGTELVIPNLIPAARKGK